MGNPKRGNQNQLTACVQSLLQNDSILVCFSCIVLEKHPDKCIPFCNRYRHCWKLQLCCTFHQYLTLSCKAQIYYIPDCMQTGVYIRRLFCKNCSDLDALFAKHHSDQRPHFANCLAIMQLMIYYIHI